MAVSKVDAANQIENQLPQANIANNTPFRNIIINGDMSIAQRATSVSSVTGTGYRAVDRFRIAIDSAGTWTISQSTDVPTGEGFTNSLKLDCTTADASLSASDNMAIQQNIEGQNLQYLKFGTSNAQKLTLSFWVKSSKTGTYTLEFEATGNTRHVCKTYTIDTADTWEKKIITIDGDTSSALANDNTLELRPLWWLAAGSNFTSGTLNTSGFASQTTANRVSSSNVNLADSTSNDFYLTGVQLEAGEVASDFEFLPFDVQLMRCKRYYQQSFDYGQFTNPSHNTQGRSIHGMAWDDGNATGLTWEVEMRATPTVTFYGGNTNGQGTSGKVYQGADKTATAQGITQKKFSYIEVTSGRATNYTRFAWVANAEL